MAGTTRTRGNIRCQESDTITGRAKGIRTAFRDPCVRGCLLALLILIISVPACVEKPVQPPVAPPLPTNVVSVISVPVEVDLSYKRDELAKDLKEKDPLSEGKQQITSTRELACMITAKMFVLNPHYDMVERATDECIKWADILGPLGEVIEKKCEEFKKVIDRVKNGFEDETKDVSKWVVPGDIGDIAVEVEHKAWIDDVTIRMDGRKVTVTVDAAFMARENAFPAELNRLLGILRAGNHSSTNPGNHLSTNPQDYFRPEDYLEPDVVFKKFDLTYEVKEVKVKNLVSCGYSEDPPKLRFTASADLTVDGTSLKVGPIDWKYEWIRRCHVTFANIDLEQVLQVPFIKEQVEKAVNDELNKLPKELSIQKDMQAGWDSLQQSVSIGPNLWFAVNPQSIGLGQIEGKGSTAEVTYLLKAVPKVVYGAMPVPATTEMTIVPPTNEPSGIHLVLAGEVAFDAAQSVLQLALATDPVKPFVLRDPKVYSDGDRLFVRVKVDKPFKGEVILEGRPSYNANDNTIRFLQFDFSQRTKNFLVKVLDTLLHEPLRRAIEDRAVFPVNFKVEDELKKYEGQGLVIGSNVTLTLSDIKARINGLKVTRDSILAFAEANAAASAKFGKIAKTN